MVLFMPACCERNRLASKMRAWYGRTRHVVVGIHSDSCAGLLWGVRFRTVAAFAPQHRRSPGRGHYRRSPLPATLALEQCDAENGARDNTDRPYPRDGCGHFPHRNQALWRLDFWRPQRQAVDTGRFSEEIQISEPDSPELWPPESRSSVAQTSGRIISGRRRVYRRCEIQDTIGARRGAASRIN